MGCKKWHSLLAPSHSGHWRQCLHGSVATLRLAHRDARNSGIALYGNSPASLARKKEYLRGLAAAASAGSGRVRCHPRPWGISLSPPNALQKALPLSGTQQRSAHVERT